MSVHVPVKKVGNLQQNDIGENTLMFRGVKRNLKKKQQQHEQL